MLNRTTNDTLNDKPNYDGFYLGTVVFNTDDLGLNRIKASIPNMFDTDRGDVPWLAPFRFSPFGYGAGYGMYGSPAIGSKVIVFFQDSDTNQGGDSHYGFYVAGAYSKDVANADFASPDLWGFTDPSGNKLIINLASKLLTFVSAGGYTMTLDSSGNMTQTIPGASTINANGGYSLSVQGNVDITATGIINVHATVINLN